MIICRQPKNGVIKKIYLEFSSGAELEDCIQSAKRLARGFSDQVFSCQVVFSFEGVELEVSEFSNPSDLSAYFSLRRRMRRVDTMPGSPA